MLASASRLAYRPYAFLIRRLVLDALAADRVARRAIAGVLNDADGAFLPTRWHNEEYDYLFHSAEGELDPVKRAALFIAMNDMVVEAGVVIPVVYRPQVSAISRKLRATLSGWDSTFWNLKDWYREA
jgi:ABC-type transport system substrate-binding protein